MMTTKLSAFIIGLVLIGSIIGFTSTITVPADEINGIYYSHGMRTFYEQGQGFFHDKVIINDEYKQTTIYSGYLPLITNYTLVDTLYIIIDYRYFFEGNGSETTSQWIANQEGMKQYVNYILSTIPQQYEQTLNVTEDYPHEVYFLSTDREYLGSTYMNSTFIEFLDYMILLGTFYHAVVVVPLAFIIQIETELVYVTVNDTYYARAVYGAAYAYYYAYAANVTGYYVEITDKQTFGISYFGTIKSQINYYESYYCVQAFYRMLLHNVTITSNDTRFTDANGNVLYKYYPRSMLPSVIADYGSQTINWNATGTFETRTPLQVAIQAFVTRSTNNTVDHFAVWGIANPTRMIAYDDGNDNNQLDVYLDVNNELKHDPIDWVRYIGFPEAYRTTIDVEYYISSNYTSLVFAPGINLNETFNVNSTKTGSAHLSFEIGNVDDIGNVNTLWDEPTINDDGTVTFSWGIEYSDYPVLWYNTTDNTLIEDRENIAYYYTYTVDLANGNAKLSTVSVFGGITDTGLASAMDGLSLATYQVSELLTVERIVGDSESGGIGAYVPTNTTNVEITYSDSTELVDVSMGGNKQTYHIGNDEYNTATSVINLAFITGSVTVSNTTDIGEFGSPSDNVNTGLVDAHKQQTTYNWLYRKDLIIINYPTWNGQEIVHDPTFTSYFTPSPVTTTSTSTSTQTTSSPTTSITTSGTETGRLSVPFFTLVFAVLIIGMLPMIKKRKLKL